MTRQAQISTEIWRQIAKLWDAELPNSATRRMIIAECQRCGYRPGTILRMHGSKKS